MASQTKGKNPTADRPARAGALHCRVPRSVKVHAMCEDYRDGAYADFEIDKGGSRRREKDPESPMWRCGAMRARQCRGKRS